MKEGLQLRLEALFCPNLRAIGDDGVLSIPIVPYASRNFDDRLVEL